MEARLRQLEGKMLASDSGVARGKADIARYDPSRQGAAGAALLTAPKAYNPDADVTADAGKEQKKAKKKKVGPLMRTQRSRLAHNLNLKESSACLLGWETAGIAADTWLSADLCSFLGWDDDRLEGGTYFGLGADNFALCRRRMLLERLLQSTAARQQQMAPWISMCQPLQQSLR